MVVPGTIVVLPALSDAIDSAGMSLTQRTVNTKQRQAFRFLKSRCLLMQCTLRTQADKLVL